MSSLQLANCSVFVPQRRETLGRRLWTVVQTSNTEVDDNRRRCRLGILATIVTRLIW